jgi:hypothetical protein
MQIFRTRTSTPNVSFSCNKFKPRNIVIKLSKRKIKQKKTNNTNLPEADFTGETFQSRTQ